MCIRLSLCVPHLQALRPAVLPGCVRQRGERDARVDAPRPRLSAGAREDRRQRVPLAAGSVTADQRLVHRRGERLVCASVAGQLLRLLERHRRSVAAVAAVVAAAVVATIAAAVVSPGRRPRACGVAGWCVARPLDDGARAVALRGADDATRRPRRVRRIRAFVGVRAHPRTTRDDAPRRPGLEQPAHAPSRSLPSERRRRSERASSMRRCQFTAVACSDQRRMPLLP